MMFEVLVLVLALCTVTTFGDESFVQYDSARYYYNNAAPANKAPFPIMSIEGVVQMSTNIRDETFILSKAGKINVLHLNGTITSTDILTTPLNSSLAATDTGVVVCSPLACIWYDINHDAIVTVAKFAHDIGKVLAMSINMSDSSVWVGGSKSGLLHVMPTGKYDVIPVQGNITAIAIGKDNNNNNKVAVGTTQAVYHHFNTTSKVFAEWVVANGASLDGAPTSLTFLGDELWIGGKWCLNVVKPDGTVGRIAGQQGLPSYNITSLSATTTQLWIGTEQGVASMSPNTDDGPYHQWRYFAGERWIPGSSKVIAMSTSSSTNSSIWIATELGLGRIFSHSMSMASKSAAYTKTATTTLSRHGWVAGATLSKYGDPSSLLLHDGDNDGLWTGMLVSGLIYEYATTKSEAARDLAWKHYAAVEFLHNVTETKGFIARSAVKCDESHGAGDSGVCPHNAPNSCGWVNSSVCYNGVDTSSSCCWTWKRDTSSDEVTGHFFTMLQAWMFLAENDDEKKRIENTLCQTAQYIINGQLKFIDPISKQGTSWGYWDPEQLNGIPGKPNERGENSLEVLGYLAAAAKVCENQKNTAFSQTFANLVRNHGYDKNLVNAMATSPQSLAFFDFRLAFMSFHTLTLALPELMLFNGTGYDPLIPLTKQEQVLFRQRIVQSVNRYWNDPLATSDAQRNWDAGMDIVYQRITGMKGMEDSQWQIKRYPTELIEWPYFNTNRKDISLLQDWLIFPNNQLVVEKSLPADEAFGWSDFTTEGANCGVNGGNGHTYQAPNTWLLIHWMQEFYFPTK